MDENYHPELDESDFLPPDKITIYRSLIGSANWIITLGRFDIQYATNMLARFSNAPREGHLRAMYRLFGYLRKFHKGKIVIDIGSAPVESEIKLTIGQNWSELYPDACEDLPPDMPIPRGAVARIIVYVDADHAHDKVTRRSISGIILLINNTP